VEPGLKWIKLDMIASTTPLPMFSPGQLVRHKRYGYRGVVVDYDPTCQASDEWYRSNQTQPDRNQPWYHVLVHGTSTVTYAAQTSLDADASGEPVVHPLVSAFFSGFTGEQYIRNDRPWPSDE
jgi:heat shock protein HspQ